MSARIFSASSRLSGASTLKWSAPRTTRNDTFGFVFPRRIRSTLSAFPSSPSITDVGDLIEASHFPGERISTSFASAVLNPRNCAG